MAVTLEQIHKDLLGLKKEVERLRKAVEEERALAADVVREIEESKGRPRSAFISHREMKEEFG